MSTVGTVAKCLTSDAALHITHITNYHLVEKRVAELRLLFRAGGESDSEIFAYVLWFSPTKSPDPIHGLREVNYMMRAGERAGGVIRLSDILGACPLASKVTSRECEGVDQNTAYRKLSTFYINAFASHTDYELYH